jgi:hypothetical protein
VKPRPRVYRASTTETRSAPTARIVAALVAGAFLVLGGLVLGFTPVSGKEGGEGFHCGSPFVYDDSEGYGGSDGFNQCNGTREARLAIAVCGVGVGAVMFLSARRVRRHN